MEIYYIAD